MGSWPSESAAGRVATSATRCTQSSNDLGGTLDAVHGDRELSQPGREIRLSTIPRQGRLTPEGLQFVSSWVAGEDVTLLQRWVAEWSDLVDFEIVPVVAGKDVAGALSGHL